MSKSFKNGEVQSLVIRVLLLRSDHRIRVVCVGDFLTRLGTTHGVRPDQLIGVLKVLKRAGVVKIKAREGGVTDVWLTQSYLARERVAA